MTRAGMHKFLNGYKELLKNHELKFSISLERLVVVPCSSDEVYKILYPLRKIANLLPETEHADCD